MGCCFFPEGVPAPVSKKRKTAQSPTLELIQIEKERLDVEKQQLKIEEQRLMIEQKRLQIETEKHNIQLCQLGIISEANLVIPGKE